MRFICHLVTKYPVSSIYIAFIWVLCFMDVPQTPLNNVTLMDKWVHILMYAGTCATIWWEYIHRHETMDKKKLFLLAWLAPIIMSGAIELLQAYCTGGDRKSVV